MACLKLTKGYFSEIDDADYAWASPYNWCVSDNRPSHVRVYRNRLKKDKYLNFGRHISLAREILFRAGLLKPNTDVDHIDGNTLNNRRLNLRCVTHQQNIWNSYKKPGTSKYKGVSIVKRPGRSIRWHSQLTFNGCALSLGFFSTEMEAAIRYNHFASMLFGEFAKLNLCRSSGREVGAHIQRTDGARERVYDAA